MELPKRKKHRLPDFDYSSENYYFVTICTYAKKCLFGKAGKLNALGRLAEQVLITVPQHRKGVKIDKYVIMPNHVHAIIVIGCDPEIKLKEGFPSLSTIVGSYKSAVSREIHRLKPELTVWQESFHEHVIRNDHDYRNIWLYIDQNPISWLEDEYNNGFF
ncbi:MAG: transposase [Clostridiales bacterium]|nr:transposase [Clostridiales bacterium]